MMSWMYVDLDDTRIRRDLGVLQSVVARRQVAFGRRCRGRSPWLSLMKQRGLTVSPPPVGTAIAFHSAQLWRRGGTNDIPIVAGGFIDQSLVPPHGSRRGGI